METQNRWGLVLLATAFAGVVIAVALFVTFSENKRNAQEPAVVPVIKEAEKSTPETFDVMNPDIGSVSYVGVSPTDTLAAGLADQYQTLTDSATSDDEKKAILDAIVAKAVPKQEFASVLTLANLNISNAASADTYAMLLALILSQSSTVREYEMATFLRAVRDMNHDGSPELQEDATIYRQIRDALVAMAVPTAVAREHLAVVNDVGALAQVVAQMGEWNGDPTVGIVYVNAFERAQSAVVQSLSALTAKLSTLKPS
jgi:hypothetical protein